MKRAEVVTDDIVDRLTRAIRIADRQFETTGGTTRHYVNDCFLPALEKCGLLIKLSSQIKSPLKVDARAKGTRTHSWE